MNFIKTHFWYSLFIATRYLTLTCFLLFGLLPNYTSAQGRMDAKSTSIGTDNSLVVQNGRLVFSHKKEVQKYFEKLERMEDETAKQAIFTTLYSRGFFSLLTMNDDDATKSSHAQNRQNLEANAPGYTFDEYGDANDPEEIISFTIPSDEFAAMLNGEGEIEVAGKIYKYTPNGLFIVDKRKIRELNAFLDKNQIPFPKANPNCNGELIPIGDEGFIDWYFCNPCPGCWGPPNPTTPPSPPQPQTWEQFYTNSIQLCNDDGAWIANLFGDVKVCKDYYSNEKRVKTKFWNQNFLLAYSTGIKTKYQLKKWYGWTKRNVDEIRLGINTAYYEYNISLPTENSLNNAIPTTYVFDGDVYPLGTPGGMIQGGFSPDVLPELPFDSDLEIIVTFFGDNPILSTDGQTINEAIWSAAYNQAKDWLQDKFGEEMPDGVTLIMTSPQKIIMVHRNENHNCTNCKKRQFVFDWGFGGGISMPVPGSGGSGGINPVFIDFDTPENFHIDFFGAARRINTWKGSRIVFAD